MYVYHCLWSNMMCFDNANGVQVVERVESFRTRQSKVNFVLQKESASPPQRRRQDLATFTNWKRPVFDGDRGYMAFSRL